MKGEMAVMDATGDSKVMWDSENADEVAVAQKTYEDLTKKGYRAFSVKKGGAQDELINEFDPDLEKMILVPPIKGG